jgi:hypothetical protein
MRLNGWKASIILTAVLLLAGCSPSFEEEQKSAGEAVEAVMSSRQGEVNNSNEEIEYHLPFGVEKEKETLNNILLKNGSKTYILFYNPHENAESRIVYESTLAQQPDWDVKHTFKKEDKFGYLLIKRLEDDAYRVVTGIGGVKVTTETKNLKSDAALMMNIANSVKVK